MGVEFRVYLIPTTADHRPASEQAEALVRKLVEQRWLPPAPSPEYVRAAFEREEAKLAWPVDRFGGSRLRYPFVEPPCAGDETYYRVELHVSDDFVHPGSELIDPLDDTTCACGQGLEAEGPADDPFHAGRLRRVCPACRRPFDPSGRSALCRDPWTGEEIEVAGGVCYRFALVIDAGKCIPSEGGLHVHPELKALCERALGVSLKAVGDLY